MNWLKKANAIRVDFLVQCRPSQDPDQWAEDQCDHHQEFEVVEVTYHHRLAQYLMLCDRTDGDCVGRDEIEGVERPKRFAKWGNRFVYDCMIALDTRG